MYLNSFIRQTLEFIFYVLKMFSSTKSMKKASKASNYNFSPNLKQEMVPVNTRLIFLLNKTNTVSNTTDETIIRFKQSKPHKIGKNALEYLTHVNTNHTHAQERTEKIGEAFIKNIRLQMPKAGQMPLE